MAQIKELDARQRPPENTQIAFKKYRKVALADLQADSQIIDFANNPGVCPDGLRQVKSLSSAELTPIYANYTRDYSETGVSEPIKDHLSPIPVYEAVNIPGLLILPQLLSPLVQIALLDKLLHRDVSNPVHLTNLHPFYDLPYERSDTEADTDTVSFKSFFQLPQEKTLPPKDSSIHRPLSMKSLLNSKLRWATLGGQYDWTNKVYPSEKPPEFPADHQELLSSLFPGMKAQAAIVNLYSPGDTLSMHRDVSEECDRDLASISVGCDAIFQVTNEDGSDMICLRIRSGDAVLMTGPSRFAWHGVPRVLKDTCPTWLQDWPYISGGSETRMDHWRGWMATKRINFNVRQMSD